MNAFQTCRNISDITPFYLPLKLYLKPIASITISVQLPNLKNLNKSISHWEVMEKIRHLAKPDEFTILKVIKTTIDFIRIEGELEKRTRLEIVISKLDSNSFHLKDINEIIRVRAIETKSDFPTRFKWDTFFQDAKDMDEMKPGQRPDTLHLANLPIKWFVPYESSNDEVVVPSEKLFCRIFEKFGPIRSVDIPICDPYRKKMKDHISGIKAHPFNDKQLFEGYVQFKDYIGFCNAMDALRGMKLLKKDDDENQCINIKVDFEKTKHLSDATIRRREIVRDRLVKRQAEKEEKEKMELEAKKKKEQSERQKELSKKSEKEKRRREREEKRKAKILEKLKLNESDEINEKIAKEEKKLLKAQRKLEAIRLIEELFRRIKDKKGEEINKLIDLKKKNSDNDELKSFKNATELEVLNQRHKLHDFIEGRVTLKNILSSKKRSKSRSLSGSSSETSLNKEENIPSTSNNELFHHNWYNYSYQPNYQPPMRGHPPNYFLPRGHRGRFRPRRGFFQKRYPVLYHSQYSPEIEEQYIKYFSKFLNKNNNSRRSRSRSRRYTRSRSRSCSRYRSYSRERSRTRYTRSRSYNRSRSSSRSRSNSRSKRRHETKKHFTPPLSRNHSKERSSSVDSSKFLTPDDLKNINCKSRSEDKSPEK